MSLIKLSEISQDYSRIIAGVMRWGVWGVNYSSSQIQELIEGCIDMGVSTFDHADIYGDHSTEAGFGNAIFQSSVSRSDIQLITKCGIKMLSQARPQNKIKSYDTSKSYIIAQVEESLKNLKTDYIDLLLIHRPGPLIRVDDIAEDFQQLDADGKVLDFGVSNFTPSQYDLMKSRYPIVTNQVEVSVKNIEPFLDGTVDNAMKHKIAIQSWSPLGGAELFQPQSKYEAVMKNSRLNAVCKDYNWSLSQMALMFLLHHPAGILPVLGTSKLDRIKEAVSCLSMQITDEQWYEIWTACTGFAVP